MGPEWPVDAATLAAARRFITGCAGRIAVASDHDVDGLAAAVIVKRALVARGAEPILLPVRRGEHVHQDGMRRRILATRPSAVVVVDIGTKPGPIVSGLPTLVIDHHDASKGVPDGALLVNGYDREPVATTSVLAYIVCRDAPGIDRSAWLAALGAIADLGTAAPFEPLTGVAARGAAWKKAVSLLNAARRAPQHDPVTALAVLERATDVRDIADLRVEGAEKLDAYRRAVQDELARCSRSAPERIGTAALIRCASAAQIHPLLAARWSQRLAPAVVIAANEGYLPGRVNFALRSSAAVNLLQWLRTLPFEPSAGAEYANGHPRATGGSLTTEDFARFVEALRARADAAPPTRAAARRSRST